MRFLILVCSLFLVGCSALELKAERAEDFGEMVLNPHKVHFEYMREGDNASYRESRCTGKLCDEN